MRKTFVPPIKSQGIKTKLVPWIKSLLPPSFNGRWIEPFMGTGVVGFNVNPKQALMADSNPHLISFYQALKEKKITPLKVKAFLTEEGSTLLKNGESHYYKIRERFNLYNDPLDFLFLNRSCFNGMIRFNKKGGFNVPFCRKPDRFAQAYVTKIVNQVEYIYQLLQFNKFEFVCQDFQETIKTANINDIIYCDPPYIDRHTDYYNGWDNKKEHELFKCLLKSPAKFILSIWHHNDFRKNEFIEKLWDNFQIQTREHFYHVGAKEINRNPMIEALVTNFKSTPAIYEDKRAEQLVLFEQKSSYQIAASN